MSWAVSSSAERPSACVRFTVRRNSCCRVSKRFLNASSFFLSIGHFNSDHFQKCHIKLLGRPFLEASRAIRPNEDDKSANQDASTAARAAERVDAPGVIVDSGSLTGCDADHKLHWISVLATAFISGVDRSEEHTSELQSP